MSTMTGIYRSQLNHWELLPLLQSALLAMLFSTPLPPAVIHLVILVLLGDAGCTDEKENRMGKDSGK